MSATVAVDAAVLNRRIAARLGADEAMLDELFAIRERLLAFARRAREGELGEEHRRAFEERVRLLRERFDIPVVWERDGAELSVYPFLAEVTLTGGWLVVAVEIECEQTGRAQLKLVFFLGGEDRADGLGAAFAFDPSSHPGLVATWGEALRAAVWDAVLDVLEGAVVQAGQMVGAELALLGFSGSEQEVRVTVGA